MLRYTTDRTRPGLVTLYDIWPGNGAGQFLQPRSPHRAYQLYKLPQYLSLSSQTKHATYNLSKFRP